MRSKLLAAGSLFLPTLVGLGGSAALLVDSLRISPVFCAEDGGCEAVRHTPFAAPFGVPMPTFGVLGFALLGGLFFARGKRVRAAHAAIGLVGAAFGLVLIGAQVRMGHVCPYCMSVDVSACLVAVAAVWRFRGSWDVDGTRALRATAGALLVALPGALVGFGLLARARLPPVIASEMQATPKGRATVVEFVDFECPYCRMEQDDLAPLLEAEKARVHVVRKLVPLTRIHPHAMDAARAACCAEALGKGDAMADALFRVPVEELTSAGCAKIATTLGLDEADYVACISDPKTDERIATDRRAFDRAAAKGDGLPLLWIGEKKIMGAEEPDALRRALDAAIAKAGS
jgi:uncharacterized membrane protein/protein-disulfide isomerase